MPLFYRNERRCGRIDAMNPEDKGAESDRERFEKNLAALMRVPKDELERLEAQRTKRSRKREKT